jgi:hypothetical protein
MGFCGLLTLPTLLGWGWVVVLVEEGSCESECGTGCSLKTGGFVVDKKLQQEVRSDTDLAIASL